MENSHMIIKYRIDKERYVRLFGYVFVNNNKDKCKIEINRKL